MSHKSVLTKCLPDKTSKLVLTIRLPDKTSKAVLTKCLPDKTSADRQSYRFVVWNDQTRLRFGWYYAPRQSKSWYLQRFYNFEKTCCLSSDYRKRLSFPFILSLIDIWRVRVSSYYSFFPWYFLACVWSSMLEKQYSLHTWSFSYVCMHAARSLMLIAGQCKYLFDCIKAYSLEKWKPIE